MEVAPGVFMTKASSDEWGPSSPATAGELLMLCAGVGLHAGIYRSVPGMTPPRLEWTAPSREVKIVLEGTLKIEIENGPTLELQAGDMASIPKGTTAWWSISDGYREFWVLDDEGTPA